ncbi:MAG: antibiotic biosynthesis monooxygenase family protein [Candidatus Rokuibacteriota bacterium]
MVTVVTHVPLKEGTEREWDTLMLERMSAAKKQRGWVGGQLLRSPNGRVIVGTWQSRADWEEWHTDPEFVETRRRLDSMADGPTEPGWHEVVADVRKGKAARGKRSAG